MSLSSHVEPIVPISKVAKELLYSFIKQAAPKISDDNKDVKKPEISEQDLLEWFAFRCFEATVLEKRNTETTGNMKDDKFLMELRSFEGRYDGIYESLLKFEDSMAAPLMEGAYI